MPREIKYEIKNSRCHLSTMVAVILINRLFSTECQVVQIAVVAENTILEKWAIVSAKSIIQALMRMISMECTICYFYAH